MDLTPISTDSPVIKIGAVVVRVAPSVDLGVRSASEPRAVGVVGGASPLSAIQILILRPLPKHAGEVPHFVLPRGSRQYQAADGTWHDARDLATAETHRDTLEPFLRAVRREVEEEAGVTPGMLARAEVRELGARSFASRSKGAYPIHWFVVVLDAKDADGVTDRLPDDASEVRWAKIEDIKEMATRKDFSQGYVPVIEEVLASLNAPD